ncbi:hypothetical protein FACS189491_07530 [Spirochaetia bacterium]|nr:hypothetical protein FACS189491_07530 [Spirochaetia bacterium]
MNSLDGEKLYLQGLKAHASTLKNVFGENSESYRKALQAIKEQQEFINWVQKKVSSGEQKECWPDNSGSLQSQVQALAEHEQKAVDAMSYWWECKKTNEDTKD